MYKNILEQQYLRKEETYLPQRHLVPKSTILISNDQQPVALRLPLAKHDAPPGETRFHGQEWPSSQERSRS